MQITDSPMYSLYREGIVTRHITCSGRYLSELWLREMRPEDSLTFIERHRRTFTTPLVFNSLTNKTVFSGSPVEARSEGGPSLSSVDNRLHLAWSGAGDDHLLQLSWSSDGVNWQPKQMLSESSVCGPSLVFFKGYHYLAWTGRGDEHYLHVMRSTDFVNWADRHDFKVEPCIARSDDGPCLAVAGDRLYLTWSGVGEAHRVQLTWTNDGATWQPKQLLSDATSDCTPALAFFRGRYFIAWTGRGDEHYLHVLSSADGVTWTNRKNFRLDPCRARSNYGPRLNVIDDRLIMSWAGGGNDSFVQMMWSDNGLDWKPKFIHFGSASYASPTLAAFDSRYFVGWNGPVGGSPLFPRFIQIASTTIAQTPTTHKYVPWISKGHAVFGGGENPLLRGGMAMAAFAVEYIVKNKASSLGYAALLLDYFERCEARNAVGEPLGFFLRCHNLVAPPAIELHASQDEITGMILGLFYLYRAAMSSRPDLATRVSSMMIRLGNNLCSNGYIIVRPADAQLRKDGSSIHIGASGLFFSQWALQEAFYSVTGNRYEPRKTDYAAASRRLWTIYKSEKDRLDKKRSKELLSILGMWHLQDRLPDELDGAIWAEVQRVVGAKAYAIWYQIFGFAFAAAGLDTVAWWLTMKAADGLANETKDPLKAYLLSLWCMERAVYFGKLGNWFNLPLMLHSVQHALSSGVNASTMLVAQQVGALIHTMLGDRLVNHPDDDFYAAVVAKGLLANFTPLGFLDTADNAINARSRMWPDLPAGEPSEVREMPMSETEHWWQNAPVRWHNSSQMEEATAYIGRDFCWERIEGKRLHANGRGCHTDSTGMDNDMLASNFNQGYDALLEAGGLDFFLPRVLLAYWLGEPLDFDDKPLEPLQACTCLPFSDDAQCLKSACCRKTDNFLLFSIM